MAVTGTQIIASGQSIDTGPSHGPSIDFDSAGNLWAAFYDNGNTDMSLFYSSDDGASWTRWGRIHAAVSSVPATLVISDDDIMFVAVKHSTNGYAELRVYTINTTTPASTTQAAGPGITLGGTASAILDMRVMDHPDQTGDYILACLENDDGGQRLGIRAIEYSPPSTVTDNGVIWFESSNPNSFDTGVFLGMKSAKNARVPSTPSSPELLVKFMEDNAVTDYATHVVPGSWDSTNDRWTGGSPSSQLEDPGMHMGFILPDDANSCWYLIGNERTTQKWQVIKYTYSGTTTVLTDSTTYGTTSMAAIRAFWVGDTIHCIAYEYGGDTYARNIYDTTTDTWDGWTVILTSSDIAGLTQLAQPNMNVARNYDANGKVHALVRDSSDSNIWWVHLYTVQLTEEITDPSLTSTNVLYTDGFAHIVYDTVLGVNDWSDPDWDPGDWYYGEDDQLYVDVLTQTKVLQDTALVSINQLFVDGIDATRFLTDTQLESVNQFYAHGFQREVNADPYWRWRFVRQNGHLFLIPAKSAQGWREADVVSVDFRYNSDLMDYAMTSLVSAWATHSGSATATLKAAINTALGDAGFKDMQGNAIT